MGDEAREAQRGEVMQRLTSRHNDFELYSEGDGQLLEKPAELLHSSFA